MKRKVYLWRKQRQFSDGLFTSNLYIDTMSCEEPPRGLSLSRCSRDAAMLPGNRLLIVVRI